MKDADTSRSKTSFKKRLLNFSKGTILELLYLKESGSFHGLRIGGME
jgi:hypothetical protein